MTQRLRATEVVCAALLLVAATAARLPGINGDLWLDEAWVANSVLAPTWREMFFYPPWLQSTPPLYLVITRLLVAMLGEANWVFRLFSLLSGLASVGFALRLGQRLFPPLGGWLAGALVALSSSAVMFSKEGKSYSAELCVALALMTVIVELPAWWVAWLTMLVAFGFSYSSVIFFPSVFVAYFFAGHWRVTQGAKIAMALALPLAATYWFYVRPNQGGDLHEMWSSLFPASDWLGYYFRATQLIFWSHLWPPLFTARKLLLLLAAVGIARAGWQLGKDRDGRLLLATVCPLLGAVALNLIGFYPYGPERFSVYLIGVVTLLIVAGLDWPLPKLTPAIAAGLAFVLVTGTLWASWAGPWPQRVEVGLSEARQELLRRNVNRGDLLFVAPLQWESWLLAQRRQQLPVETMEGRVASACCPRDGCWQAGIFEADVAPEMDQLLARGTGRRIWMLHLRLAMFNPDRRTIPERWQRAYLARKGCREEYAGEFHSTVLTAYRCPVF